jgi:uncharacterized membrane protein
LAILKKSALFAIGGLGYVGLELLWRGRSHGSMFFAGGSCFLLLGRLDRLMRNQPVCLRGIAGAGVITAVELAAGLLANREYQVWDYRALPLNLFGHICLPFTLAWVPVSLAGMYLYRKLS